MKLYRNWIINEVARAMTKGEHTKNIRTYTHTYVWDKPYIPSTTLCEGITKGVTDRNGAFINCTNVLWNSVNKRLNMAFVDLEKAFD